MATVDGRVKGNMVVGRGLRRARFVVRYGLAIHIGHGHLGHWRGRMLGRPKSCTCLTGQILLGPLLSRR
jgi:hypothetical protein